MHQSYCGPAGRTCISRRSSVDDQRSATASPVSGRSSSTGSSRLPGSASLQWMGWPVRLRNTSRSRTVSTAVRRQVALAAPSPSVVIDRSVLRPPPMGTRTEVIAPMTLTWKGVLSSRSTWRAIATNERRTPSIRRPARSGLSKEEAEALRVRSPDAPGGRSGTEPPTDDDESLLRPARSRSSAGGSPSLPLPKPELAAPAVEKRRREPPDDERREASGRGTERRARSSSVSHSASEKICGAGSPCAATTTGAPAPELREMATGSEERLTSQWGAERTSSSCAEPRGTRSTCRETAASFSPGGHSWRLSKCLPPCELACGRRTTTSPRSSASS